MKRILVALIILNIFLICAYAVSRYSSISVNTVKDNHTGLMWTKDYFGPYPWWNISYQAIDACESLNYDGRTDWRLPNITELQSLVDYGRYDPSIDSVFASVAQGFWSSTSKKSTSTFAWYVDFSNGKVSFDVKTASKYVRCVAGP
ncbi:MAG TPA: DUF1566 domain-containing protein [Spirochaetota bacterium]|nr:DUF1566 domain-containing protein [Spirochaetota bacterium]HNT10737.1 DUF1566 domain-containing protein [Spirochaetota bacterium]